MSKLIQKKTSLVLPIIISAVIIALDRFTKLWVLHKLSTPVFITNWLSFERIINRGVSFGIFDSSSTLIFTIVSVLVLIILFWVSWLAWHAWHEHKPHLGFTLVLAGGYANLWDRIFYHGVIDFIWVSYQNWHWPAFNIADSAIVLGALIIVYQNLHKS